jgi:hypothetical protein
VMILRPALARLDLGIERIVVPQLQRIDRLHVVMAIKQHMRRVRRWAIVMGDNHRMAGVSRTLASKPIVFRSAASHSAALRHIVLEIGIGRDRFDAQQAEQALQADLSSDLSRWSRTGFRAASMLGPS